MSKNRNLWNLLYLILAIVVAAGIWFYVDEHSDRTVSVTVTDIPIEYTGLRPGEKLYEELLLSGEGMQKTKNDLIYIGHEIAFDPAAFEENLMLLRAIPESDEPALRAKLREMVPTFHAPDGQTLPQDAAVG